MKEPEYILTFVKNGITDVEREERLGRALKEAYKKGIKEGVKQEKERQIKKEIKNVI